MKDKVLVFKKFNGTLIEDVNQYVKDWVKKYPYGEVMIGCDSQEYKYYIKYSVVIVMHRVDKWGMGHGAHVIYAQIKDRTYKTKKPVHLNKRGEKEFDTSQLYEKLWLEAELTVKTAQMLTGCEKKITIHLDYNSKESEVSNVLYAAGLGLAQGMGYKACGKPEALSASYTADRLCR